MEYDDSPTATENVELNGSNTQLQYSFMNPHPRVNYVQGT